MFFFFFNDTATTEIYTLSLHDALPIWKRDDQFIMILDIDKVFSSDELAIVQDAGGYATAEEAETEAGRRGDGETGISRRV